MKSRRIASISREGNIPLPRQKESTGTADRKAGGETAYRESKQGSNNAGYREEPKRIQGDKRKTHGSVV